jgi:hypothetical protein
MNFYPQLSNLLSDLGEIQPANNAVRYVNFVKFGPGKALVF